MKSILLLFVSMVMLFLSCNRSNRVAQPVNPGTPQALQEKSVSGIDYSKRGDRDDLVAKLYQELLAKDTLLNQLENTIGQLNEEKPDSLKTFLYFREKNEDYYKSAQHYIGSIKDSIIREKIKSQLLNSENSYHNSITRHSKLVAMLESRDVALADLHNVLKIVKTMAVMEKYQKEDLPSSISIIKMIARFEKAIAQADKLNE